MFGFLWIYTLNVESKFELDLGLCQKFVNFTKFVLNDFQVGREFGQPLPQSRGIYHKSLVAWRRGAHNHRKHLHPTVMHCDRSTVMHCGI